MVYGIWAGGLDTIKGSMTVGQLVAFINYLIVILNPIMQMPMVALAWAMGWLRPSASMRCWMPFRKSMSWRTESVCPNPPKLVWFFNDVSFHYNAAPMARS